MSSLTALDTSFRHSSLERPLESSAAAAGGVVALLGLAGEAAAAEAPGPKRIPASAGLAVREIFPLGVDFGVVADRSVPLLLYSDFPSLDFGVVRLLFSKAVKELLLGVSCELLLLETGVVEARP
mmetsp:Transcript_119416/g.244242  ORF Transcript_119416/g.244242 Transcript_119416/m.244242 type:complete len:125 (-) Transcript_119416:1882-2256(-)